MKKILLLFVMALYVSSCTQDLTQNENMQPQSDETTAPVKSGVLHFNSVDDLSSTISQMKERQAFDIKHLPATRAAAQALNGEFVSWPFSAIEILRYIAAIIGKPSCSATSAK